MAGIGFENGGQPGSGMNLAPLIGAEIPIPSHAIAALVALVIGSVQLVRRKGTSSHVVLGWAWVALMVYVAISSLFINEYRSFGPFSPIHLLIFVTLGGLFFGIRGIRRGQVTAHRQAMIITFSCALVVAGVFTLLPGRTMHQVVFG